MGETEPPVESGPREGVPARHDPYRAMFAEAPVGMTLTVPETGRYVEVNDRFCAIVGFAREELLGKSWMDLTVPEEVSAGLAAGQAFRGGAASGFSVEKRYRRKDGGSVWVRLTMARLSPQASPEGYCLTTVEDISAQRAAEQESRDLEAQLATLLRVSRAAIVVTHLPTGRIRDANEAFLELFGYAREQLVGRTTAEIQLYVNPDDRRALIEAARATGQASPREVVARASTGELRTVVVSLGTTVLKGEPHVVATLQDVTEVRQLQLLQTSALEAAPDGVIVTGVDGRIQWINAAVTKMTGYTLDELRGTLAPRLVASAEGTHHGGEILAQLQAKRPWRGDVTALRKDGSTYPEHLAVTPVVDAGGTVRHTVAIKRDMTEARRAQDELRAAQRMEAVGRLAGGIAHDFNNLLSVILSYTEAVVGQLDERDPLLADLKEVESASRRAATLTRQLLAFSRRQVLEVERVDVDALVDGLSRMLRRIIGEDIVLVREAAPDAADVMADRGQLEQVVMNLVVNARDAMPRGGRLTISTRSVALDAEEARALDTAPGDYVALDVTDTGTGMDDATRARIFEPFFTTKGVGKGTGLGLATVFGIVKQSRGAVEVETTLGKGSRFRVYLPRAARRSAPAAASIAPQRIERARQGTVLVVEDEVALRNVVARTLTNEGYEVLVASSPEDAVQLLEAQGERVDLLLTDVVMPGINGRDIARGWQARRPDARVLYMSGYADVLADDDVAGGHLLRKPFDRRTLRERVAAALAE